MRHDAGPGHPENAARLALALAQLDAAPPAGCVTRAPPAATSGQLAAVHGARHLETLAATAGRPRTVLDPDTSAGPRSEEVARLAAGAAIAAVQEVVDGRAHGALALVRPPGHHAEAERAMGFCLYNNVAVAAAHALREGGLSRVLVLDPDIHHGNGTQRAFEERAEVLYVSSHRYPFYPGTGWYDEVGRGAGAGFSVNLPLPMGLGDADLLHLYREVVGPIVAAFEPQLVLVSAGFDTWHADPVGDLALTERGFSALGHLFRAWADAHCPGRLVHVLEGGYAPEGVAAGVRATLAACTAPRAEHPAFDEAPSPTALQIAARARAALSPWWAF